MSGEDHPQAIPMSEYLAQQEANARAQETTGNLNPFRRRISRRTLLQGAAIATGMVAGGFAGLKVGEALQELRPEEQRTTGKKTAHNAREISLRGLMHNALIETKNAFQPIWDATAGKVFKNQEYTMKAPIIDHLKMSEDSLQRTRNGN